MHLNAYILMKHMYASACIYHHLQAPTPTGGGGLSRDDAKKVRTPARGPRLLVNAPGPRPLIIGLCAWAPIPTPPIIDSVTHPAPNITFICTYIPSRRKPKRY